MRRVDYSEIVEDYGEQDAPYEFLPAEDPDSRSWQRDGVVIKPGLVPDSLIDLYRSVRDRLEEDGGWNMPCPYLHYPEIKCISLYRPITKMGELLVGHQMGLHLNLTGYVSTERDWHADDYLNPDFVKSKYMAVWIALEDIDPDSGVFQYIPGSHRWPPIRRHLVEKIMKSEQGIELNDPLWPTKTQGWVADACEHEIRRRGAKYINYVPKKGDVLFWHGRLIHRGSAPRRPGLKRRALIAHYSSIYHRPDFPKAQYFANSKTESFGAYFDTKMPLEGPQRV